MQPRQHGSRAGHADGLTGSGALPRRPSRAGRLKAAATHASRRPRPLDAHKVARRGPCTWLWAPPVSPSSERAARLLGPGDLHGAPARSVRLPARPHPVAELGPPAGARAASGEQGSRRPRPPLLTGSGGPPAGSGMRLAQAAETGEVRHGASGLATRPDTLASACGRRRRGQAPTGPLGCSGRAVRLPPQAACLPGTAGRPAHQNVAGWRSVRRRPRCGGGLVGGLPGPAGAWPGRRAGPANDRARQAGGPGKRLGRQTGSDWARRGGGARPGKRPGRARGAKRRSAERLTRPLRAGGPRGAVRRAGRSGG